MHQLAARALSLLAPPFCWNCGAGSRLREALCPRCRHDLRWLPRQAVPRRDGIMLFAPVAYDGPARALVRGFKYRGAAGLAEPLAAAIAANAPPGYLAPPAVLVPVPLHPARRRKRGFNQAERLASALVARTGLGLRDCLERGGPAVRQVERGRDERLVSLAGAVALASGVSPPRRAVLVDDVVTTGATIAACAHALRGGGTEEVAALAYARTPAR
jgi:ComF family protein